MQLVSLSDSHTFAELNGGQPLGECPCGRGPTVAQFSITVREYRSDRRGLGKQHGSLTRARCESCCVEMFLAAREALAEMI